MHVHARVRELLPLCVRAHVLAHVHVHVRVRVHVHVRVCVRVCVRVHDCLAKLPRRTRVCCSVM